MAIDSGVIDGPIEGGGAFGDERARRGQRRLRIALHVGGDRGDLERDTGGGGGLVGVVDRDADRLVLRRPGSLTGVQ